uniref:FXYD domain-containing ion transport regulator n=1 Tax=Leptobrachium leishanense TaxID=445787 RepID=A0A8C5R333_9ANUR
MEIFSLLSMSCPEHNRFFSRDPDYDTVRMTGLILAIVMFVLGIVIALSKFFSGLKDKSSHRLESFINGGAPKNTP